MAQAEEETNSIFKFWYEKLLMRFSFTFAFFAFIGVFIYAYFTEVLVELPGETAPFIVEQNMGFSESLAEAQTLPLDQPHRTDRELKVWITTAVSEALFFDADNYNENKKIAGRYFTASGLKQYEDYLLSSGVLDSLKKNSYRMSVFIEEQPLLMNSLEMQDVYRWLYQLPLTISFIPKDASSLLGNRKDIVNRKLSLRIQLRRVRLPDDPDAIQIESWAMSTRRN